MYRYTLTYIADYFSTIIRAPFKLKLSLSLFLSHSLPLTHIYAITVLLLKFGCCFNMNFLSVAIKILTSFSKIFIIIAVAVVVAATASNSSNSCCICNATDSSNTSTHSSCGNRNGYKTKIFVNIYFMLYFWFVHYLVLPCVLSILSISW